MPIPTVDELPAPSDISRADLRAYLAASAELPPNPMLRAAVHLVNATRLLDSRPSELDNFLDLNAEGTGTAGEWRLVARPRWDRTGLAVSHLSQADAALIDAARSLASNRTVWLVETCVGLPSEHARVLAEAVLIATGLNTRYLLTAITTSSPVEGTSP